MQGHSLVVDKGWHSGSCQAPRAQGHNPVISGVLQVTIHCKHSPIARTVVSAMLAQQAQRVCQVRVGHPLPRGRTFPLCIEQRAATCTCGTRASLVVIEIPLHAAVGAQLYCRYGMH